MIAKIIAWIAGTKAWLIFAGMAAVVAGLFVAHRKGVSKGEDAERSRQVLKNQEKIRNAVVRDAAADARANQMIADSIKRANEATAKHAEVEERREAVSKLPRAERIRLLELEAKMLERDLHKRGKN